MNNIRLKWVDALKFLGIVAIYIGHLGAGAGKLYPFVFSYHVPLFFFIAGFFSKDLKGVPYHVFFIDKAKRLLLPYFSFSFILLIINSINTGANFQSLWQPILDIIYGVRNNPFVGTIWFINCLFVIIVIDGVFLKLIHNNRLILLISISFFVFSQTFLGHNPLIQPKWFWNIDSAISYWWLMALGRCMFKGLCDSRFFGKTFLGVSTFLALSAVTAYQLFNSRSLLGDIVINLIPSLSQSVLFGITNTLLTTTWLIFFNVFIAKIVCNCSFINQAGMNTLNICGLENITKLFIPSALAVLGLNFGIPNPAAAIVYTLACLYVSNKIGQWLSAYIGKPFKI